LAKADRGREASACETSTARSLVNGISVNAAVALFISSDDRPPQTLLAARPSPNALIFGRGFALPIRFDGLGKLRAANKNFYNIEVKKP
jgi:hypothetical protein